MAQKVVTTLIDDLDGDGTLADETVEFALDGKAFEIDLSDVNAKRLREALAEFVAAARKAGSGGTPARARRVATAAVSREESATIRAWARENGWPGVKDRGRIPVEVVEAYRKAA